MPINVRNMKSNTRQSNTRQNIKPSMKPNRLPDNRLPDMKPDVKSMKTLLVGVHKKLLTEYGPRGWWPLASMAGKKGFDKFGYHKGSYNYPKTNAQRFEICVGAILTQNTSWKQAEKAIESLQKSNCLTPQKILTADSQRLAQLIRPAGYFNQKAKKLRIFSEFFLKKSLKNKRNTPRRDELLKVWGIGPETADSILLYAYNMPEFVVDTYTKRLCLELGITEENTKYNNMKYEDIKELFQQSLSKDVHMFQEYHALIVEHGKNSSNRSAIRNASALKQYLLP